MKVGILYCGYNSEEYVYDSLAPFVARDDFIISAVSVPFAEYRNQDPYEDRTTSILRNYLKKDRIHNLVDFPKFIKEHEARDLALQFLLQKGVDLIFLVDADEIYTDENIEDILTFVKNNEAAWYTVSLKNFVFDKKHYLEEPFSPPRIFRTKYKQFIHPQMYWDNDFAYHDIDADKFVTQNDLPKLDIPKEVAWVDHYTWLSDNIGKRKVKYQEDRGWECSYRWNRQEGKLEFNTDFYKNKGVNIPTVLSLV